MNINVILYSNYGNIFDISVCVVINNLEIRKLAVVALNKNDNIHRSKAQKSNGQTYIDYYRVAAHKIIKNIMSCHLMYYIIQKLSLKSIGHA